MKWDGNKKTVLISRAAACLFLWVIGGLLVWSAGEHRFYAFQNRALTAENKELSGLLAQKKQDIVEKNHNIDEKAAEIEELQKQFADDLLVEEYVARNGFHKKNGFYLIDTEKQLFTLWSMLREGEEIEPGLSAAQASYRLRNDIDVGDKRWFCLGTEENPFCGIFDGDGHTIEGRFPLMDSITPKALFHMDESAKIENLHLNHVQYAGEIWVGVNESRDCDELESHLPGLSNCSVRVEIEEWGLDVEQAAKALRRHWEQSDRQDGYYVSMTYHPYMFEEYERPDDAQKDIPDMQEALCMLAGEEYAGMIREAMAKEEGYLWFVRLEQVGELTCCTFEIGEPKDNPDTYYYQDDELVYTNVGYYIVVEGKWEGKEVPRHCIRIPYTDNVFDSIGVYQLYGVEAADLDFDGKLDLLIHEGYSGGSGGSWSNYRALTWKEELGRFDYFPSFPENVRSLELDRKRVVNYYRIGLPEQHVKIYEVVNGEYVCTRELLYECDAGGTETLSYYEMGELVETHILSEDDEIEAMYPDMDYWPKG